MQVLFPRRTIASSPLYTLQLAEIGLNMTQVALNGFSARGSLAVTVSLLLRRLGLDTCSYNRASHTSLSAVGGTSRGRDDV